ncbi:hydrogenase formation protein HypD [bacterium]|nr:hydrogenase formation protein HypD [bacterium]
MDFNQTLKEYENRDLVLGLAGNIEKTVSKIGKTRLMHVCGTHEHEIVKYGIRQLLPPDLEIIPGPGCPVCICPVELIDEAITLSYQDNITVLTFGDMLRVPATKESLDDARNNGGSVKMVYGPLDAIKLAQAKPNEKFVFFSVGFETTTAGIAGIIKHGVPDNLFFLIANRYIPPVFKLLMEVHDRKSIQGFLLAGHAATITGIGPYGYMKTKYQLPCVVAGFTPVDILSAINNVLLLIEKGEAGIINSYSRVVNNEGNQSALKMMDEVFNLVPGVWRGISTVDGTAYSLKEKYKHLDAEKQFDCTPPYESRATPPGCQCHRIMLGEIPPTECKMFKSKCTPNDPYGPCMVSLEGTCHTWFHGFHEIVV